MPATNGLQITHPNPFSLHYFNLQHVRKLFFNLLLLGSLFLQTSCHQQSPGQLSNEKLPEDSAKAPSEIITLSPEATANYRLTSILIHPQSHLASLTTFAALQADESRRFMIHSPTPGQIQTTFVQLGDTVQAGQKLALLKNPELIKIQGTFIHDWHQNQVETELAQKERDLAHKRYTFEKELFTQGVSAKIDFLEAQNTLAKSEAKLNGLKEHETHIKSEATAMLGLYGVKPNLNQRNEEMITVSPLISPHRGTITKKTITQGTVVSPEQLLYEITDLSHLWIEMTIYPKDINQIHAGQAFVFQSDSLPGKSFTGRIQQINTNTDAHTPIFQARATLLNPTGQLKPGMVGSALIQTGNQQTTLIIPENALQQYGKERFVFLSIGKNRYQHLSVESNSLALNSTAAQQLARYPVVTTGSDALKAIYIQQFQVADD